MTSLTGRHILVTGASMGIGLAVARRLADDGARVMLVARGTDSLKRAVGALPGDGHTYVAQDVVDLQAWERLAPRLGDVDGVVTAAGMLEPVGPIGSYSPTAFMRTLEVNVVGVLNAVHYSLPALRAARGAVVTFSGGGATAPLPRYDAYAASKAAVVRLTENLAEELRDDGVRVNAVAPGFVATMLHRATLEAGPEQAGRANHDRTLRDLEGGGLPPTEAAELTALLLGPRAEGVTGKLISAQWDPWRDTAFLERLANERDIATLRRIDDVLYVPRSEQGVR